jgi:hypothetical protein
LEWVEQELASGDSVSQARAFFAARAVVGDFLASLRATSR